MRKFTRFEDLDDDPFFKDFVKEYFDGAWGRVSKAGDSAVKLDPNQIDLALSRYRLNIQQYTVVLKSAKPDQYKRAGALLHALYTQPPIVEVVWGEKTKHFLVETNVGVTVGDYEFWTKYTGWFEDYCNQMMAFDLAFRCCQVHEGKKDEYTQDYLDNMCYYMRENTNINVGSFVMIFKSYWA